MSTLSHDHFDRDIRTSSSSADASIDERGRFSHEEEKESLDTLDRSRHSDTDSDYGFDNDHDDPRVPLHQQTLDIANGKPSKVSYAYPPVAASLTDPEKLRQLRPSSKLSRWRVSKRIYRCLCLLAVLATAIIVSATAASGVWAYRKGTILGESPPWYPTPRGGIFKTWNDSYTSAATMVRNMSLIEKVNITTGTGWMMGPCVGNTGPATGVGFPGLCLQDGPQGLRFADKVTAGPAGITVGATFNKELMYKRGKMLGLEARVKGVNVLLGPSIGPIGKMPAGGRNWEGFGSDPVLQGLAAAATIKGIQEEGVMATIKHYVGNEQEHFRQSFEWGLPNAISSNIDDRTLHELYAWPFADSVRAGVASVMCAYNQVNNSYACQNSKLLNGILKDELGFQGFVQSDWLAQRSGVASALAGLDMSMPGDGRTWANGKPFWGSQLTLAVLNGSLPVERLDDMATRIVAAWYQVGQNDTSKWPKPPPDGIGGPNFSSWTDEEEGPLYPGSKNSPSGFVNQYVDAENAGTYSHAGLARRIAAEGTVLLKNENNLLPLTRKGWSQQYVKENNVEGKTFKVAIIGEDATANPNGPNACADRGCNKGTLATGWGSGTAEFPFLITPLDALKRRFYNKTVTVTEYPTNTLPSKRNRTGLEDQDLCIVFANADGGEGFIAAGGIRGDRNDLYLQRGGDNLVQKVANTCGIENPRFVQRPDVDTTKAPGSTIVVIHSIGPVILESFVEHPNVPAVVFANLPGEHSGNALADVLFGDINPSGHLPFTIGKCLEDYGPGGQILFYPNKVIPQQQFNDTLYIDYRHFDAHQIEPRYEFGYGLSYSSFSLHNLTVEPLDNTTRPSALPSRRPEAQRPPPTYHSAPSLAGEALFPRGFRKLSKYIYPYIDSVQDVKYGNYPYPPQHQEAPSEAGGGEGGNPALWETLAKVTVTLVNNGPRDGQAVVQLYVSFPSEVQEDLSLSSGRVSGANGNPTVVSHGAYPTPLEADAKANLLKRSSSASDSSGSGVNSASFSDAEDQDETPKQPEAERINFPVRVLRGFEKVQTSFTTGRKSSWNVTFELTRRDLSYWSARHQNWVLPEGTFGVEVGFSSRDLRIKSDLF